MLLSFLYLMIVSQVVITPDASNTVHLTLRVIQAAQEAYVHLCGTLGNVCRMGGHFYFHGREALLAQQTRPIRFIGHP
jgi:hypothetical protein